MKIHNVINLQELHATLSKFHIERKARKWVFRGQLDRPDWPLVPKAGRLELRIPDENLFRAWKRHAYALENRNLESDWEWLYIAQHHGLVTRLLDWTTNPLAAVFFGIRHMQKELGGPLEKTLRYDVAVWAYRDNRAWGAGKQDSPPYKPFTMFKDSKDENVFDPVKKEDEKKVKTEKGEKKFVQRVAPKSVTQRIVSQHGIFTYHDPPNLSLEENIFIGRSLEKIVIDRICLPDLQLYLSLYGLNEKTMFPDLEGLSRFLNWDYRKINNNKL